MTPIKISELQVLNQITNDDYIVINDSGSVTTYRATFDTLSNWMTGSNAKSASYAESSSYSISSSYALTSSYAGSARSASFSVSSSYATISSNSTTASYALSGISSGIGTGTENYLPKWTATNTLTSTSNVFDNGTNVGINNTTPGTTLDVVGVVQATDMGRFMGWTATGATGLAAEIGIINNEARFNGYSRPAATHVNVVLKTDNKEFRVTSENFQFTGSVVAPMITGSLLGSSSYAVTSSYAISASWAPLPSSADTSYMLSLLSRKKSITFDYDMINDTVYVFPVSAFKASSLLNQLSASIYITGGGGGSKIKNFPEYSATSLNYALDLYSNTNTRVDGTAGGGATVKIKLSPTEIQSMNDTDNLYITIGGGGKSYFDLNLDSTDGGNTYIQIGPSPYNISHPILHDAIAGGGKKNVGGYNTPVTSPVLKGVGGTAQSSNTEDITANGEDGNNGGDPPASTTNLSFYTIITYKWGQGGNGGSISSIPGQLGSVVGYEYKGGVGGYTPSIPGGGGSTHVYSKTFYDSHPLFVGSRFIGPTEQKISALGEGAPGRVVIEYYQV